MQCPFKVSFDSVFDEWGTEIQAFQVLDFDLNPIGDPNGTIIYPNPFGMNQPFSKLVTGENGYVYVAFSDTRSWDLDIYLQKYDELGNQQWEDGGVLITDAANDDMYKARHHHLHMLELTIHFVYEFLLLNIHLQL